MKKTLLAAAFLVLSTISFSGFAAEDASTEVTFGELCKDGFSTTVQAALMYGYFAHIHESLVPKTELGLVNKESASWQTFDIASKGFCAALFGNQAKSFFEKLVKYVGQKLQPVKDVLSEAMEIA